METTQQQASTKQYKVTIVWKNVIALSFLHLIALYGLYVCLTNKLCIETQLWLMLLIYLTITGTAVGAHRLFTHRCFTANTGLRALLVVLQTLTGQNCLYVWARDHRQHHKFCDTDADPHNSNRGFFFCHMGWLMVRKHPDVITKGRTIDMSDLDADPFVMFQKKYFNSLYVLISIAIPTLVPYWGWGENLLDSFAVSYTLRYILSLHGTWLVNSAAHMWGMKPYNKNIRPVENVWVSVITGGEGWHNYHHQFPWDYKAADLGVGVNMNRSLIELLEALGWASNLRSVSSEVVRRTAEKHGDESSTSPWGHFTFDKSPAARTRGAMRSG